MDCADGRTADGGESGNGLRPESGRRHRGGSAFARERGRLRAARNRRVACAGLRHALRRTRVDRRGGGHAHRATARARGGRPRDGHGDGVRVPVRPTRMLFSLGYRSSDGSLDDGRYDLLASEARLLSFVAIAKGDVPMRHWFRLGRLLTPVGKDSVLLSWSGSMFEYLMPGLIMRAPIGSLLEQTCRLAIQRQITYAAERGVPWGMSESGYNVRDLSDVVPVLELRRARARPPPRSRRRRGGRALCHGARRDVRAERSDPQLPGARRRRRPWRPRLLRVARLHAANGFPRARSLEVVRMYMAHHQGMAIVAIADVLNGGAMRTRFHAEPMIRASELLLQERTPRDVAVAQAARRISRRARGDVRELVAPHTRHFSSPHSPTPRTQLLSNGRYAVMITAAGSGYSRCGDMAVTRWREDATRDDTGSLHLPARRRERRALVRGVPAERRTPATRYDVSFAEDRAEFVRRDGTITTRLEVIVSSEDDAEVRRVSITNDGARTREIEVTSYAEVVLAPRRGGRGASGVLEPVHRDRERSRSETRCSRPGGRDRTTDAEVWLAHVLAVEGETIGDLEWETDRGPVHRARAQPAQSPRADGRRGALENRRCGARPDRQPAAARPRPARQDRSRGVLHAGGVVARRGARPRGEVPRRHDVRARRDARLDAGAGPAAPPRHRDRRGAPVPDARRIHPVRRPRAARVRRGARAAGGGRRGALGARDLGRPADRPRGDRRRRRHRHRAAAAARAPVLAHEAPAPSISSSSTTARRRTCRTCRRSSRRSCERASRCRGPRGSRRTGGCSRCAPTA